MPFQPSALVPLSEAVHSSQFALARYYVTQVKKESWFVRTNVTELKPWETWRRVVGALEQVLQDKQVRPTRSAPAGHTVPRVNRAASRSLWVPPQRHKTVRPSFGPGRSETELMQEAYFDLARELQQIDRNNAVVVDLLHRKAQQKPLQVPGLDYSPTAPEAQLMQALGQALQRDLKPGGQTDDEENLSDSFIPFEDRTYRARVWQQARKTRAWKHVKASLSTLGGMEALLSTLAMLGLCVKGMACLLDVASWGPALYAGLTVTGAITASLGFSLTVLTTVLGAPLLGVATGVVWNLFHRLSEKRSLIKATLLTVVVAVALYGVLVLIAQYVPFLGTVLKVLGHLQFFYVWMQMVWEWAQDGLDCQRLMAQELGKWSRILLVKLLKIFQPALQNEMHKNTVVGLMARVVEALTVGLAPLTTNQLAVLESQERVAGWVTGIPNFFHWLNQVVP